MKLGLVWMDFVIASIAALVFCALYLIEKVVWVNWLDGSSKITKPTNLSFLCIPSKDHVDPYIIYYPVYNKTSIRNGKHKWYGSFR